MGVTRGEFDPREYKKIDKEGWAKKRRADWMATTGKIRYVRERVVPSEERELPPENMIKEEKQEEEIKDVEPREEENIINESPIIEMIQKPKGDYEGKPKTEFWPRKKR